MKNILILIITFLSLSISAQEIIPDQIFFNYDDEYFSKVGNEIFLNSKRTSKNGFRFLITDSIPLSESKIEGINFKDFLVENNFAIINDDDFSMRISKFIINTRSKQLYIVKREKEDLCIYKVTSVITEI